MSSRSSRASRSVDQPPQSPPAQRSAAASPDAAKKEDESWGWWIWVIVAVVVILIVIGLVALYMRSGKNFATKETPKEEAKPPCDEPPKPACETPKPCSPCGDSAFDTNWAINSSRSSRVMGVAPPS
jgi:flagellar basal body-associated protein FliL